MLHSGLPDHVVDEEDLARFLTQSNQFNKAMAKPSAFLPSPAGVTFETSVSRHGREPIERLRSLGRLAAGERSLHGAAIVKAHVVRSVALTVDPDEPPDFHAVIRDWPRDIDPELQKAKQKEAALTIAQSAELVPLDKVSLQ